MRLTVIGSGPARPQPDTPASGILVETAGAAILLDCGPGVIRRLSRTHDPRRLSAVVVGHLHADHYLDLAHLRYLFPWAGEDTAPLRVLLPPGGRDHMTRLAGAISERPTFFDEAFTMEEYESGATVRIGDASATLIPGQHYVPAWGTVIRDSIGTRLAYAGDTGPTDAVVEAAHGADLLVCEATLRSADEDERRRGHMTGREVLDHADRAGVGGVVLTHYAAELRPILTAMAARSRIEAAVARPGLSVELVAGEAPDFRRHADEVVDVEAAGAEVVRWAPST